MSHTHLEGDGLSAVEHFVVSDCEYVSNGWGRLSVCQYGITGLIVICCSCLRIGDNNLLLAGLHSSAAVADFLPLPDLGCPCNRVWPNGNSPT